MATSAPTTVTNPPNPQVSSSSTSTVTNVDRGKLLRNDPATAAAYTNYRTNAQRVLTEKYVAEGASLSSAREDAEEQAIEAANQQFAPQIAAAGAGIVSTAPTPLLAQQPQPPSGPTTPVAPAVNPQVPPPPRALPNPAPGESRLVNTLEDFGTPIPPPPGFFDRQRVRAPAPAAVAGDPANITGNESAFVPTAPDPTATPGAVTPASNPQVPTLPGFTATTIPTVNEGKFKAADPSGYAQFQAYEKRQQTEQVGRLTALAKQNTGKDFLTAKERSIVNADAATLARREAIKQFTPQILAADAGKQVTTQGPTGQVPTRAPGAVGNSPYPRTAGFVDSAAGAAQGIKREPVAAGANNARQQAPVQAQTSQPNSADWRVRLRLAPQSQYLYNAAQPGILQPLKVTNGVIFPYTPQISTQYLANYSPYNLTHSNFKGYFYQGSNTGEVKITAAFTAQDTAEANYLLAVIHFFRSATKMFYGATDAFRGAPPPLVFLSGLGEYQFNNHACVIQSFDYTLPADVDYIRANSSNNTGTTLTQNRDRQNLPVSSNNPSGNRLQTAGLTPGGIPVLPAPTPIGTTAPTYVPTRMDISIVLLPMQTRIQVSQQFSMEKFANGNLLKGGFW